MFRGTDALSPGKIQRRAQVAGGGFQRVHQRRLDLLPHDDPGLGPGDGRRDRGRPVPEPQVRRALVSEGSPGGAGRVQQERVVAVPEAERDDAGHGLHDAYLQAHDDRLPGRHQGHAQPVRLQQGLLRPLVPPRELHDHRGGRREARGPGRAGRAILRRLEARQGAGDDSGRAAPDRAEVGAADLAAADAADPLPGLSHPGGRSRRIPTRPRSARSSRRSSARPARSTRSWCSRNRRS